MQSLFLPMFAHLLLSASLYVILTVFRAPKIWGLGARADGSNPFALYEPRVNANLSNQFEWPVFFHIICLCLIVSGGFSGGIYLALAWLFIIGRLIHSGVQILTGNIRLRGVVFTVNFLAVLAMWGLFLKDLVKL